MKVVIMAGGKGIRISSVVSDIPKPMIKIEGINADSVGKVGVEGKPVKVDLDRQLLKPLAGTGKMFCLSLIHI